jgi:hypothetical protein
MRVIGLSDQGVTILAGRKAECRSGSRTALSRVIDDDLAFGEVAT